MSRRLTSIGAFTLAVLSMAQKPNEAPKPPPAVVPTARRVIAPSAPPPAPSAAPAATPPAPVAPPPVAPPSVAGPSPAPNSVEKARQGVVVVERQGKPVALGAVLDGDGRILSALSPLANGNFLSVRYSDGTLIKVQLVHSDRGWDLALLAPLPAPTQPLHKAGLRAARTPSFVGLQSFAAAPGKGIAVTPASLSLSAGLRGGDGVALGSAYELGAKPALVGAPVVNGEGEVVALVARACPTSTGAACVPVPYGAPVSALKQFLQRAPMLATWLGVEGVADQSGGLRGVRIAAASANGPAAFAGLRAGKDLSQADLILAVDGAPVTTPAELDEAVRARGAGESVELLLFGLGRYRHVRLEPRPTPQPSPPARPAQ